MSELTPEEQAHIYLQFCKDSQAHHLAIQDAERHALILAVERHRLRSEMRIPEPTEEERLSYTPDQWAADALLRLGDCGLALLNVETLKGIIAGIIAQARSAAIDKMSEAYRSDVSAAVLKERERCKNIAFKCIDWESNPAEFIYNEITDGTPVKQEDGE